MYLLWLHYNARLNGKQREKNHPAIQNSDLQNILCTTCIYIYQYNWQNIYVVFKQYKLATNTIVATLF